MRERKENKGNKKSGALSGAKTRSHRGDGRVRRRGPCDYPLRQVSGEKRRGRKKMKLGIVGPRTAFGYDTDGKKRKTRVGGSHHTSQHTFFEGPNSLNSH